MPTTLSLVSGGGQTGTVGEPLPTAPVVRVVDQFGAGMTGVTVTYTVALGGGNVGSPTGVTDGTGHASPAWTLGTVAGTANNRLDVTAAGIATALPITAGAQAGPVHQVTALAGDDQEGPGRGAAGAVARGSP